VVGGGAAGGAGANDGYVIPGHASSIARGQAGSEG
jgi:hypothetical protein